jgi:hypothetical protein
MEHQNPINYYNNIKILSNFIYRQKKQKINKNYCKKRHNKHKNYNSINHSTNGVEQFSIQKQENNYMRL